MKESIMAAMDVLNIKKLHSRNDNFDIISCFIVSTMDENKDNEADRSNEHEETEDSSPDIELHELLFVVYILTSLHFLF